MEMNDTWQAVSRLPTNCGYSFSWTEMKRLVLFREMTNVTRRGYFLSPRRRARGQKIYIFPRCDTIEMLRAARPSREAARGNDSSPSFRGHGSTRTKCTGRKMQRQGFRSPSYIMELPSPAAPVSFPARVTSPSETRKRPGCSPGLANKKGCTRSGNNRITLSNVIYTQRPRN